MLANAAQRLKACTDLPRLLLVTDEKRLPDPLPALVRPPAECASIFRHYAIIFRHYDCANRRELARNVAKKAQNPVIIAGDWRLAAECGAFGLHLPEGMLRSGRLAPALGWARRRGRVVTAACHSRQALAFARKLGLNAALLSPVFPTASHPGAVTLGALRFRQYCRNAGIPVYALGGITARTARHLRKSGAAGLAAALCQVIQ